MAKKQSTAEHPAQTITNGAARLAGAEVDRGHRFTEADGRQLAVDMLRELREEWRSADLEGVLDEDIKETLIDAEPTTLRRYLTVVQQRKSAPLERGFLCVVSNYIAGATDGTIPDPEYYEQASK
jgi:hypothetical protein